MLERTPRLPLVRAFLVAVGVLLMLFASTPHESARQVQAAPPAPNLTAPAQDAELAVLGVTLAWDVPQGATQFQLQVVPANNDGPGVNIIRNAEGRFTIPAPPTWYVLLPGMSYTWRVRMSDKATFAPEDDASWGPWSETRTFRTPPPTSFGIQPLSPPHGAVLEGTTPTTLRWSHPDPAIFYFEVQVSGDTRFDPEPGTATSFVWWNLVHGGVTSPSNSWQTPPLEPGTTYYWRVRPRVQGDGAPAPWSPVFTFQTPGSGGATGAATITSHRSFAADLSGFVHVVGEVVNDTSAEIYTPQVTVSFFMPDGRPAGGSRTSATLNRLGPGQRAGFRTLDDPQPGWSRYTLSVTYSAAPTAQYGRPSVRNTASAMDGNGVLHITGEIVNDTGMNLRATKAAVILYDGQGQVLNVDSSFSTPEELAAGAVATFDVTFPKEYSGHMNTAVAAEGWRQ